MKIKDIIRNKYIKMHKNISLGLMLFLVFNICFSNLLMSVDAALYAYKGDKIPYSEVKYDEEDTEFTYFPESYRENLKALKKKHPNWTFMAVYNNLDWYDSVSHESYEKGSTAYISTVPASYSALWKKDGVNNAANGDSNWVIASKSAVAYAMDPRNFLSEHYIFQFEVLSWAKLSKEDLTTAMKYLLPNMYNSKTYVNTEGKTVEMEKSYIDIIYEAGEESGVNPLSIITKIKQEVGDFKADGTKNSSVSGTVEGYNGYYNFFNVKATDGVNAIVNGLKHAKEKGWDTPEKSIKAGAQTLYNDYIKYGQNTLYNQKFDVTNIYKNAIYLYCWQYMTNIIDPSTQAQNIYSSYEKMGILDSQFVFYIPVYENMPQNASQLEDNLEITFKEENTEVKVINCEGSYLTFRNGISTSNHAIGKIENGTTLTRLGVYSNGFAKVKLQDGTIGYVSNEYLEVVKNETNKEDNKQEETEQDKKDEENKDDVTQEEDKKEEQTKVNVTSISLDKDKYEIYVGDNLTYKVNVAPENATDKTYKIVSKDSNILAVDGLKVVGKKAGSTTLTFTSNDGKAKKEVSVTVKEQEKKYEIDASKISVNDNKINNFKAGSTLASVKAGIKLYNDTKIISKDVSGKELNDASIVGTGSVVTIVDKTGKELISYTIIVKGDSNGDGKISAADYVQIKNSIMGTYNMNDIQKLGADANKDSKVSAADYVLIKNHIMGVSTI